MMYQSDKHKGYADNEQMLPAQDQRQEYRLTGRIRVSVEIESADGSHGECVMHCSSSDISANGLRLKSPEPLTGGAILPLVIRLEGETFRLMGEVRWCFPTNGAAEGEYIAGFSLFESDQTSILEWKEAIVKLFSAQ